VANLGPDVPPADLARFLARNRADLLALSASLPEREPAVRDAIAAARAAGQNPALAIMLGGALAADASLAERLDVDFVADSLVAADRFARSVAAALPEREEGRGPEDPDPAE
jgi:methanogenic corrinoid protein MtbC1